MKKRILATLLSLCMVMSLLPVTAMAAETSEGVSTEQALKDAIAAAEGTEEKPTVIRLLDNIRLTSTLVIPDNKHIVIDGAEKKFSISPAENFESESRRLIQVGSGETESGSLRLTDITIDANSKATCVFVLKSKKMVTNNVVIQNGLSVGSGGGIMISWSTDGVDALIDINNTEFISNRAEGKYGGATCSYAKASFVFNNVKFTDNYANWAGAACYTSSIVFKGLIIADATQVFYDCPIKLTESLNKDSSIPVGVRNTSDIVAVGADNYHISNDDLSKFKLIKIGNGTSDPNSYILYIDENEIKVAQKSIITFNANDGSETPATTEQAVPKDIATALKENTFTRTGYNFAGWKVENAETTYADKAEVKLYDNVTLLAQWTPKQYNITYELNGGTAGSNSPTTHTYGTETKLVPPTRGGYDFGGWYTDKALTEPAVTSLGATEYTNNITLYAKWTKKIGNKTYFVSPVIDDQTYTGSDIIPEVIVEDESGTTVDSKEYKVICKDGSNINAGK
ncbi:InlB B-repeat-containing protein, partial [Butyricicoccus pullicaecorum]|nr:InlB B-repeat-containing protein [Butyricicoccus pullicaecorum]